MRCLNSLKIDMSIDQREPRSLSEKIKENEVTALKLQGAIETLEYFAQEGDLIKLKRTPETAE